MLLEVPPIYPALAPPSWWWVLGGALVFCAAAVLVVGIWGFWWLRPRPIPRDDLLERLRTNALRQLQEDAGLPDPRAASLAISRTVRRFVGTASGGDADYETATQLLFAATRDARLRPVAALIAGLQDACFAPNPAFDIDAALAKAKEVIEQWC